MEEQQWEIVEEESSDSEKMEGDIIQSSFPSVEGWTRLWYAVYMKALTINYSDKLNQLVSCSEDDIDD